MYDVEASSMFTGICYNTSTSFADVNGKRPRDIGAHVFGFL